MSSVSSRSSTPPTSRLKRKRDSSSDSSSSSESEGTEDVPVLSHAAKRKHRKAVLKKESVPTKSTSKKEKGDASHPVKRENSIWVGNLCYKTTPESLRRFFDGVGEITRVHLPTKLGNVSPGDAVRRENRGCCPVVAMFRFVCSRTPYSFAYVDFATPEAKNTAILMTESHLEGRRLLIKDGACLSFFSCVVQNLKPTAQAAISRAALRNPERPPTTRRLEGGASPNSRKESFPRRSSRQRPHFSLATSASRRPWNRSKVSWKLIAPRRRRARRRRRRR